MVNLHAADSPNSNEASYQPLPTETEPPYNLDASASMYQQSPAPLHADKLFTATEPLASHQTSESPQELCQRQKKYDIPFLPDQENMKSLGVASTHQLFNCVVENDASLHGPKQFWDSATESVLCPDSTLNDNADDLSQWYGNTDESIPYPNLTLIEGPIPTETSTGVSWHWSDCQQNAIPEVNPFDNHYTQFTTQAYAIDANLQQSFSHEGIENVLSRNRRDSEGSSGADSFDSGETFSTVYTDTISSLNSTELLLKIEEECANETPAINAEEIAFSAEYSYQNPDFPVEDETKIPEETTTLIEIKEPSYEPSSFQESYVYEEIKPASSEDAEQIMESFQEFIPHHLAPISENDIVSFSVTEVEPSAPYAKITNNITVVDESFLFLSQTSLNDADCTHDRRATTMNNLHERASFLDLTEISRVGRACKKALAYLTDDVTFGSIASLNVITSKSLDKDTAQSISLIDGSPVVDIIPTRRHTRNLLYLSVCITLLYTAIGSVRNLQSSINQEGGVGIISMAVSFIGYMIGSVFSASIVQSFQPRMCIIVNLIPNLIYVAANIYPAMWLMVPISFIQGVSMAILWNAMSTYVTFLARGRAQKKNERLDLVSGRFFGIFCLIYQNYLIIGNLIASLVLMFGSASPSTPAAFLNNTAGNSTNNSAVAMPSVEHTNLYRIDPALPLPVELAPVLPEAQIPSNGSLHDKSHLHLCGAAFCNHYDLGAGGFSVSDETKYLLFGIYMGCIAVAMLIALFLLEPLNERLFPTNVSRAQKMKAQLLSIARFSVNRNFLMLLPLLMYSVMQFGFISAEVTMAFITCPLGIHMVGYTMICLGVCGSLSSYLAGLFNKLTGRVAPFVFASSEPIEKDTENCLARCSKLLLSCSRVECTSTAALLLCLT